MDQPPGVELAQGKLDATDEPDTADELDAAGEVDTASELNVCELSAKHKVPCPSTAAFPFDKLPQELKNYVLGYLLTCGTIIIGSIHRDLMEVTDEELESWWEEERENKYKYGLEDEQDELESLWEDGPEDENEDELKEEHKDKPSSLYIEARPDTVIAELQTLSLVSRQMGNDAVDLFYGTNTFSGWSTDINRFLGKLRSSHQHKIRVLEIDDNPVWDPYKVHGRDPHVTFLVQRFIFGYRPALLKVLSSLGDLKQLQRVTFNWSEASDVKLDTKFYEEEYKKRSILGKSRPMDEVELRIVVNPTRRP